jgi:hypothetical protein
LHFSNFLLYLFTLITESFFQKLLVFQSATSLWSNDKPLQMNSSTGGYSSLRPVTQISSPNIQTVVLPEPWDNLCIALYGLLNQTLDLNLNVYQLELNRTHINHVTWKLIINLAREIQVEILEWSPLSITPCTRFIC